MMVGVMGDMGAIWWKRRIMREVGERGDVVMVEREMGRRVEGWG